MNLMQQDFAQGERRRERSLHASEALHLQLRQVARLYRQSIMVVCDEAGRLWSGSSLDAAATGLALSMAGLGHLTDQEGICWVQRQGHPVLLKRITVAGTTLYIAAQGMHQNARSAVAHAETGVKRILGELVN